MNISIVFFLGFLVSAIGTIPPGLLNMTTAKISLKEGHVRGIVFSVGVSVIVFFQSYIASFFASYLSNHPDIISVLQRVAFIIFVLIAIYFLVLTKKEPPVATEVTIMSKRNRFFQGMLLSSLNVFPIPYHAYMTITLASFGWLQFDGITILAYVFGATMGAFVMLYVYIFFFNKIKHKAYTSQKNMNYIIGILTAIVAIITLFSIIKKH